MIYCFNFKYKDKIAHNAKIMDEKKQRQCYLKKFVNMYNMLKIFK